MARISKRNTSPGGNSDSFAFDLIYWLSYHAFSERVSLLVVFTSSVLCSIKFSVGKGFIFIFNSIPGLMFLRKDNSKWNFLGVVLTRFTSLINNSYFIVLHQFKYHWFKDFRINNFCT